MTYNKATSNFHFVALMIYLLIIARSIIQIVQNPDVSEKITWLGVVVTVGVSIYCWKLVTGVWPKIGMLVSVLTFISIGLSYGLLVLFPDFGFVSKLVKMVLVVFFGFGFIPLIYHFGQRLMSTPNKIGENSFSVELKAIASLTKSQIIIVWCTLTIALFSAFSLPVFLRSDILGWDTSTYIFRARLLDSYGIQTHAQMAGGYQIAFPILSVMAHRLSGLDYIDIVRLLPPVLMTIISLASGYLGFLATKSHPFAILTSIFTSVWGLSPYMIANLRDNIMVILFGILALISLAKSQGKYSRFFEVLQIIFLILSGISHITLSIIFFITIALVNLLEFYDIYWLGERKRFFQGLLNSVWVPILGGLVVIFIWSPALLDFVYSLGFGLRTVAEAVEVRNNAFDFLLNRYSLPLNLPWILLGLFVATWIVFTKNTSRIIKIILVWSLLCIYWGVVLQPISYLNDRFLMMTPFYLLISIGVYSIWNTGNKFSKLPKIIIQASLMILVIGILFPANLAINIKKLTMEIQGISIDEYLDVKYINQYIESNKIYHPIIFLVEDASIYSEAFSTLWFRIIQSGVPEDSLLHTYIYFGTLDYLLRGEQTPLIDNGLPLMEYPVSFSTSSQRWFTNLVDEEVLEQKEVTIFIIDTYNKDIYNQYEYLDVVDIIAPGILVVNKLDLPAEILSMGDIAP